MLDGLLFKHSHLGGHFGVAVLGGVGVEASEFHLEPRHHLLQLTTTLLGLLRDEFICKVFKQVDPLQGENHRLLRLLHRIDLLRFDFSRQM